MWVKQLFIEDFGCYRHARIEDLSSSINVIGGPQRAGKTTLMNVLRYLGYQFPRAEGKIPPPSNQEVGYRVDADIVYDDQEYQVKHTGFGHPLLVNRDGEEPDGITVEDVYANLTQFRYHQLFTISLNELRRIPVGLDRDQKQGLESVLLGAGWGDVIQLPEIADAFGSSAEQIGGKLGKSSVWDMKPYHQQITEGIEEKEKALQQIDQFNQRRREKEENTREISELEENLETLTPEMNRLSLLEELYDTFESYRSLRSKLSRDQNQRVLDFFQEHSVQQVRQAVERYRQAHQQIQRIQQEGKKQQKKQMLGHRERIEALQQDLSGIRERWETFREKQQQHDDVQQKLTARMETVLPEEEQSIELLDDIQTDLYAIDQIKQVTAEVEKLRTRKQNLSDEIDQLESRKMQLEDQLANRRSFFLWWLTGLGGAGVFFLIGLGLLVGDYPVLGAIVGGGAFLSLTYCGWKTLQEWTSKKREIQHRNSIREIKRERKQIEQRFFEVDEKLEDAGETYRELLRDLHLPEDFQPDSVLEYVREIRDLKASYQRLQELDADLDRRRDQLLEELREMNRILQDLPGEKEVGDEALLSKGDVVCQRIETCFDWVQDLNQLQEARKTRGDEKPLMEKLLQGMGEELDTESWSDDKLHREIMAGLEEFEAYCEQYDSLKEEKKQAENVRQRLMGRMDTPAVREAFELDTEKAYSESQYLSLLKEHYNQYSSKHEIEQKLQRLEQQIEDTEKNIRQLREHNTEIEQEMEQLRSDEDLQEAHADIQKGRKGLEPLAEQYAVKRIAEEMTNRLYKRFLHRAKGELLEEASDIFRIISGGEYHKISLEEDAEELTFLAVRQSGETQYTGELSRGTREQLFLAIRLARIEQIEPPLPVILDDSTVNFDPAHRRRVTEVLDEIGQQNQLFFLTSHPEMIDQVEEAVEEARYFHLSRDHTFSRIEEGGSPLKALLKEE